MYRLIVFLMTCLPLAGSAAWSAEPSVDALSPFLDEGVVLVCRIRLERLDVERFTDRLIEDKTNAAEASAKLSVWFGALRKAGAREMYLVGDLINLSPEVGSPSSVVIPLSEGADAAVIGKLLCGDGDASGPYSWPTCATIHGAVFAGDDAALERARRLKPAAWPGLAAAMDAVDGAVVAVAVAPSGGFRRVVEELAPNLPEELGGGPSTILTKGLAWAVLALDDQPEPSARLIVQASDPKAARDLVKLGEKAVQLMRATKAVARYAPEFDKLAGQLTPELKKDLIVLTLDARSTRLWVQMFASMRAPEETTSPRAIEKKKSSRP